ncbi:MAG: trehalose-6-phosphate synthase [Desulfobacterales bacterium]
MSLITEKTAKNRLIIISNRLPSTISQDDSGRFEVKDGSGGLVTAMVPVLRNRGGLWIGWPGTTKGKKHLIKKLLNETTDGTGYSFEPVMLTPEEVDSFYYGFANEIIWPLFHDLQTRCNFDPSYWKAYQAVNRKFAQSTHESIINGDHIWIHDYHLMMAGKNLREMGVTSKIGFFLHIPFPSPDLFFKLPWRYEVMEGLLSYDLVGFQTMRDRRNFIRCIRALFRDVVIRERGKVITAQVNDREIRIGNFPISIDFDEFARNAEKREVEDRVREVQEELDVEHIVLGIDRLDYTKGIPERLAAFEMALDRYPQLRGNMSLLQLVVPSRVTIPKYLELKEQLERKISEINGRYGRPGWTPIHYMFRSIDRQELLAFYRASDVAFITPLKDGMNLVAKEYCASNVEENGVLILSEFAGASAQLQRGALLVNPYHVESVAQTLFTATQMEPAQRQYRMKMMRKAIRRQDIYYWVEAFLNSVFIHEVKDFPLVEYKPATKAPAAPRPPIQNYPASPYV